MEPWSWEAKYTKTCGLLSMLSTHYSFPFSCQIAIKTSPCKGTSNQTRPTQVRSQSIEFEANWKEFKSIWWLCSQPASCFHLILIHLLNLDYLFSSVLASFLKLLSITQHSHPKGRSSPFSWMLQPYCSDRCRTRKGADLGFGRAPGDQRAK